MAERFLPSRARHTASFGLWDPGGGITPSSEDSMFFYAGRPFVISAEGGNTRETGDETSASQDSSSEKRRGLLRSPYSISHYITGPLADAFIQILIYLNVCVASRRTSL